MVNTIKNGSSRANIKQKCDVAAQKPKTILDCINQQAPCALKMQGLWSYEIWWIFAASCRMIALLEDAESHRAKYESGLPACLPFPCYTAALAHLPKAQGAWIRKSGTQELPGVAAIVTSLLFWVLLRTYLPGRSGSTIAKCGCHFCICSG